MHQYRRMDMLKAGTWSRGRWHHGRRFQLKRRLGYRRVSGRERLMERWRGRTRDGSLRGRAAMGGRLVNAMRYKMMNAKRVDVGAVTPSAARFLEAVQAGKRGTDNRFQYTGSQPVTPAMRRAFWAAASRSARTRPRWNSRSVRWWNRYTASACRKWNGSCWNAYGNVWGCEDLPTPATSLFGKQEAKRGNTYHP